MAKRGIAMRKGVCAHCGCESNYISNDHVPPALLFPKPRPSTLFTVPSCRKCGPGTSKDEEYFREVILQQERIPQNDKIEKLNSKVLRSALRGRGALPTILSQIEILENVKTRLLGDDAIQYITGQFKKALRKIERQPDDSVMLKDKLRIIDAKLEKLADAIEAVGVSDTLANRLTILEQDKAKTELALKTTPAPVTFLPDVIPALVQRWQELVISIESLVENPTATLEDIEAARANLGALLGTVTLKPRNGVLWAHLAPNAKGFTEVKPLDGLRINRPFSGSGGRICPVYAALRSDARSSLAQGGVT